MTEPSLRKRRPDAVDERILRLLVRNARASYRDLGLAVGLSANAVAQRMRRMETEGVIRGYRVALDPSLSRNSVRAVIELQVAIEADNVQIETRLQELPEVMEVLDLAGSVDYQILLHCPDQERLYEVVQAIRALPGITSMQTRPVLREVFRR